MCERAGPDSLVGMQDGGMVLCLCLAAPASTQQYGASPVPVIFYQSSSWNQTVGSDLGVPCSFRRAFWFLIVLGSGEIPPGETGYLFCMVRLRGCQQLFFFILFLLPTLGHQNCPAIMAEVSVNERTQAAGRRTPIVEGGHDREPSSSSSSVAASSAVNCNRSRRCTPPSPMSDAAQDWPYTNLAPQHLGWDIQTSSLVRSSIAPLVDGNTARTTSSELEPLERYVQIAERHEQIAVALSDSRTTSLPALPSTSEASDGPQSVNPSTTPTKPPSDRCCAADVNQSGSVAPPTPLPGLPRCEDGAGISASFSVDSATSTASEVELEIDDEKDTGAELDGATMRRIVAGMKRNRALSLGKPRTFRMPRVKRRSESIGSGGGGGSPSRKTEVKISGTSRRGL
ncbi:hypothetical protein QBC35DRAFT_468072 [Podospora australis]|uniref:Uncharacterized protein n=1 Tax=Podospora australis TaxID=1536484 RepID=A0AAN6WIE7_9PEZI|nr:hypothetical protein QBC35DRAFT_468072 [Podospora australis]